MLGFCFFKTLEVFHVMKAITVMLVMQLIQVMELIVLKLDIASMDVLHSCL